MNKLSSWKTIFFVCVFYALEAISSPAQTLTTLTIFDEANGANPTLMSLVQGTDGNFYGTTYSGGASGYGTVFKMTSAGVLTDLYNFETGAHGCHPNAGLVLANSGNFYGTTTYCGANGAGTVFEITPAGKLTTLHSFSGLDTNGSLPTAPLVQATNGNLYGTTSNGGSYGHGTVFEITTGGNFSTVYRFCPETGCIDGSQPAAGLIQASNGNFYGTTQLDGAYDEGAVFELTPGGKLTTLYSFCKEKNCTDGRLPEAGLVQGRDGNFYGTTYSGGTAYDGTIFKITAAGELTVLHSFCSQTGCADGYWPYDRLVQAANGSFYGTTYTGGAHNEGTVFAITPTGKLTTVHSFDFNDGGLPEGGLVQSTNGDFYGATTFGGYAANGRNNLGTLFSLAVGLGPFVQTLPASGSVGTAVTILGHNLTGASNLTFNGTAATFKIVSGTEITTTVPKGATTGPVKVKTPSGTLTSNGNFQVP